MNHENIKIDKKVKIPEPPPPKPKKVPERTNNRYPWDLMKVGDSFLFPDDIKNPYATIRWAARKGSKDFLVKLTDEGYRCWRVK